MAQLSGKNPTLMKTILQSVAGNPENQDRGAVIECDSERVLVIADGAGGLSGGAEAAAMAVDLVRRQASILDGPDSCVALLQNVDRNVANDGAAGETTCVLAVLTGDNVYGASVGDSGAWVIQQNGVIDLTRRQVRKPFIGTRCASPVSFSHKLSNGEKLLIATDGLFKYTSPEKIENVCQVDAPETVASRLIELIRYPSGALPDDITIIFAAL
jgi:serine/threonine protein phosphatase PrpC